MLSDSRVSPSLNLLLGLSFFCFSLASFSYRAGILSYILLFIFMAINGVKLKSDLTFWICFFVFNIIVLCSLLISKELYLLHYVKFQVLFNYAVILIFLIKSGSISKYLNGGINYFIFIHTTLFFCQLLWYLIFGDFIDFNNMFREKFANTAYMSKDLIDDLVPIRATGAFSEPSFYALTLSPAIAYIYYMKAPRGLWVYLGLLSIFLTFSVAAELIMLTWLSYVSLFDKNVPKKIKTLIMAMVVIIGIVVSGFIYQRTFQSNDYNALATRVNILNEIYVRDWTSNMIGNGLFLDEFGVNGATEISSATIRDSGFLISTIYSCGFIGVLTLLFTILYVSKNAHITVGICILLLFKYSILSSAFWLFCALFIGTLGFRSVLLHKDLS